MNTSSQAAVAWQVMCSAHIASMPHLLSGLRSHSRRLVHTRRQNPIDSMESTCPRCGSCPPMGALDNARCSTLKATFNYGCPMHDHLTQRTIEIDVETALPDVIGQVRAAVELRLNPPETTIRLAVTKSDGGRWTCELGTLVSEAQGLGVL